MEWKTDLNILRNIPIPSKGNVIRILYHVIEQHKGTDYKDLDDLLRQLYADTPSFNYRGKHK